MSWVPTRNIWPILPNVKTKSKQEHEYQDSQNENYIGPEGLNPCSRQNNSSPIKELLISANSDYFVEKMHRWGQPLLEIMLRAGWRLAMKGRYSSMGSRQRAGRGKSSSSSSWGRGALKMTSLSRRYTILCTSCNHSLAFDLTSLVPSVFHFS